MRAGDTEFPSRSEEEKEEKEWSILGANFHQTGGIVGENAPEGESQESCFGLGSCGGKSEPAEAEGGERNGNEGRSLFFQNLSHMTSAGDTTVYIMILFADCLDFKCSQ